VRHYSTDTIGKAFNPLTKSRDISETQEITRLSYPKSFLTLLQEFKRNSSEFNFSILRPKTSGSLHLFKKAAVEMLFGKLRK
jgi:hypothetical protein